MGQRNGEFRQEMHGVYKADRTQRTYSTPMIPVKLPEKPGDKIAIDIKGPLNIEEAPKFLFVIMDYYSKWPEIFSMKKISGKAVSKTMRKVFARMGIPRTVVSDNGKQLISREVKNLFDALKIEHHKVALYAPA